VLELACGTGRIALPLAERGLDITGVDASDGMLAIAERNSGALPAAARQRLRLVAQDMSELTLDRRFGCVFVAFRSFQHLLTVDLQRRTLAAVQRHLLELCGFVVEAEYSDFAGSAPAYGKELTWWRAPAANDDPCRTSSGQVQWANLPTQTDRFE
jgi:SAM-dependent methyltransferase